MTVSAFITGLSGTVISAEERSFLRDAQPWGVILFKRNIDAPEQLRSLTADIRATLGRDAPILVDQEGGRVQRLGPPHWPSYPPGAAYGRVYDRDRAKGLAAARLGARLIAADLAALGFDVDCAPVADVPAAESDPVIGDRAFGTDAGKVGAIAAAFAEGLLAGGVLPVVKHMPGHGRAAADSHHKLPVVTAERALLESSDFAAFRALRALPLAMTAHVVFSSIDPVAPATTSAIMVADVIRRSIGFSGLLMCDDVSMEALSGTLRERSAAAIAAGCDIVLHCSGVIADMREIAVSVPRLDGVPAARAAAALARRGRPDAIDLAAARAQFAAMLGRDATVPVS
ncbi:MAG: beta-N-acetylhexosaminidase [Rhizobiales bacterium]|nr:beta-N-acetylhexosaminidase [Hyphomicrobiales bacterium]